VRFIGFPRLLEVGWGDVEGTRWDACGARLKWLHEACWAEVPRNGVSLELYGDEGWIGTYNP
jgi:hypothetical protein